MKRWSEERRLCAAHVWAMELRCAGRGCVCGRGRNPPGVRVGGGGKEEEGGGT